MAQRFWIGTLVLLALAAGAKANDKPAASRPAAPPTPALDRRRSLPGPWGPAARDGKPTGQVGSVVKVAAAGSAVLETLFPGQPHEMVSVYHRDGADLVMTHFCSLGNQPRMKADPKAPANQLRFQFAGGS